MGASVHSAGHPCWFVSARKLTQSVERKNPGREPGLSIADQGNRDRVYPTRIVLAVDLCDFFKDVFFTWLVPVFVLWCTR